MSTREMQIRFERFVRTIDPTLSVSDKLNSDTIMYFLNVAQERYIKDNYLSKDRLIENIELLNKRSDSLKNLIVRDKDLAIDAEYTADTEDGAITITLPSDYMFYINSMSKSKRSDLYVETTYEYIPNGVIIHDDLAGVVTTPINKPILRQPAVLIEGDESLLIYKDVYTSINNFYLIYLRLPKTLVVGTPGATETNECELAEHTHQEIVELAANMFIEEYRFKLKRSE